MASSEDYSSQRFLVDRAFIHDTLTKLYLAVDSQQFSLLSSQVFAPTITMDYTAMFGGEAIQRSGDAQQEHFEGIMRKMESTQHVITSIIPYLPAPDRGTSPPERANAKANVTAYSRKKLANGETRETRNGGRLECELIRFPDLAEKAEGNPWRIGTFKVLPAWDQGGKDFWGAE
ncbi:MAG: hypothetical protein M1822_004111 [Bathelium mastoideum]|nr:MAG: hypothetical protein M1822_004111 [Bathelium mastoideum]